MRGEFAGGEKADHLSSHIHDSIQVNIDVALVSIGKDVILAVMADAADIHSHKPIRLSVEHEFRTVRLHNLFRSGKEESRDGNNKD